MPFYLRIEFVTVVAYLGLMVFIGAFFLKRNRGGTDFFAAGRAVPWWVSGVSLYMGNFSAWLFTGGAGMIYRTTWTGLLFFFLSGAVPYFLGSQLAAAQWRRTRVISPVEFTRARFGAGTQLTLGLVTALVFLAAAGNQLRAIATVVNGILGVDLDAAAVGVGIIVIAYTIVGGLWAVVVTDVLQFVVLLAVALLVAPLALLLVPGGLSEVLSNMDFALPPADAPWLDVHYLVAGLISWTLGVAAGQGPRFYCVPDERSARKVGRLAAALFLTTPILFSLPSLVARTVWGGPDLLAAHIPGDNPHEQVFIRIAVEVLPPGLLGVFLAAMFAATMSALDTVYNMIASILSRDLFMHFRPQTGDRALIGIGRAMTLLCGGATIGLCLLYLHGPADLFDIMMGIFFFSAPVMHVPVLMGLFYRPAPRFAGMACIVWAIATAFVAKLCLGWSFGPQIYLTQSAAIGIFLVSPWLGELWRRPDQRAAVPVLSFVFAVLVAGLLLLGTPEDFPVKVALTGNLAWPLGISAHVLIAIFSAFVFGSLLFFARRFSRPEDRSAVDAFHANLDTPVDVEREVSGSKEAALSVFRLVGALTFVVAGLVVLLMAVDLLLFPERRGEWWKYLALAGVLVVLATLFLLPALRRREAARAA